MNKMVALILGGGRGTRLYPLTKYRSKPAVPIGGKYRLIDVPISNCIHSGVERIYILTQFNSASLHRHIRASYNFDAFHGGFVEILAAQQTLTHSDWYQGTADAVRHNLTYVRRPDVDQVLILSGDQLYRMDYRQLVALHRQRNADVTIAVIPVHRKAAPGLGIVHIEEDGRVVAFHEKPQTDEELEAVRTEPAWIEKLGVPSHGREYVANMGIYLFNRDVLVDILERTDYRDFGKEVFPSVIQACRVQAFVFDGYWEDIGTIGAFFEANLALAQPDAAFSLEAPNAPLYSRGRFLPPSRIANATIKNSLVADGCVIGPGCLVENSIIGLRSIIAENCVIRNAIIMGNDYYDRHGDARQTPLMIGPETHIENAIIDKNCRIGKNVRVINLSGVQDSPETPFGMIRDGVIVVPKETVLPDDWTMA